MCCCSNCYNSAHWRSFGSPRRWWPSEWKCRPGSNRGSTGSEMFRGSVWRIQRFRSLGSVDLFGIGPFRHFQTSLHFESLFGLLNCLTPNHFRGQPWLHPTVHLSSSEKSCSKTHSIRNHLTFGDADPGARGSSSPEWPVEFFSSPKFLVPGEHRHAVNHPLPKKPR